jgi:hypothetical protein
VVQFAGYELEPGLYRKAGMFDSTSWELADDEPSEEQTQ